MRTKERQFFICGMSPVKNTTRGGFPCTIAQQQSPMKGVFILLLLFFAHGVFAQQRIDAIVTDSLSHIPLAGATVSIAETGKVLVTDDNGRFSTELPKSGTLNVVVRYVGYAEKQVSLSYRTDVIDIPLRATAMLTETIIVNATRANESMPMTWSTLGKTAIRQINFGQDMPFLLNFTPSVVSTSDAGTGIGYTGIRIRGSDATRINVTINGIPYNDSESQGVFWVNIPDIATSAQNIQIQRGVGTSGNGAGAFGATINLQTNTLRDHAYEEVIQSGGSFGSLRTTVGAGTGKLKNNLAFDLRMSRISSDGFIDRAFARLRSYYGSAGYYGKNTIVRAILFGGRERTYQSWYGVPQSRLQNDVAGMNETAITEGWSQQQLDHLLNSGSRTFNFYTYKNQVDDYGQDHAQLHLSTRITGNLTGNLSLHYTRGAGYYEEERKGDDAQLYGLSPAAAEPGTAIDLVRRRWLDNDFYGFTWSLQYEQNRFSSILGGGWNSYDGDHFGRVVKSDFALNQFPKNYYFNNGVKRDFSVYWKNGYDLSTAIHLFTDLQVRGIGYDASGKENKQDAFELAVQYRFFNPKAGITWKLQPGLQWYGSVSVANREPVREDLVNAIGGTIPSPERLIDVETGLRRRGERSGFQVNVYHMYYRNQLVLTGALNDVGANIRTNVPVSWRTGVELEGDFRITNAIRWQGNLTLSRNVIREFTEVLYDYGDNFDQYNEVRNTVRNSDISFSPDVVGGSQLSFRLPLNLELTLLSKYVGKQYLDNTSNEQRVIDPYFVQDARIAWTGQTKKLADLSISLLAANLLDARYSSNGYTYGYLGGATTYRQNYFYPQAGRNFMLMMSVRF
ncbi:MAG: TonB-dependent receptor [Bacteroidota bacterium]